MDRTFTSTRQTADTTVRRLQLPGHTNGTQELLGTPQNLDSKSLKILPKVGLEPTRGLSPG